ncbi:MAG: hypothetical protein AB7F19_03440 [Candidatus Babeliales bacterium]
MKDKILKGYNESLNKKGTELVKRNLEYKIDIVTETKWIDCRAWSWDELSAQDMEELFFRAENISTLAQKEGKIYGYFFANEAPQLVKDRFRDLGIVIFENE